MSNRKTFSAKPTDVTREWYLLDATEAPLGRIATGAARLLTGKDKPIYTPHIDCGDYVVIINADKLKITGGKPGDKIYYRHSGYPGGIKARTLSEQIEVDSTIAVTRAIRGMLPVNKLRAERLKRLKVYTGAEHQHAAQKPKTMSVRGR
jgi:large subunit ribosomal protein L13